jgi:hypothetical protein
MGSVCLAGDNANDPGYPGSLRTWCSSLSTPVFAVVEAMSSYLGRLSLRSLPVIDLLHRWENGPGGIRTRIRALTESCATVCTTGPVGSFASRGDRCKDASHNSFGQFQIGKAGQHAENDVNVPSVPEFLKIPSLYSVA